MKKILALILAIVITLSLCVPAMAATTTTVDITYRAIKIVFNGEKITLCDANGKTVEPFIMTATGTTYLPIRAISQALGLNVNWEAATNTITLTDGGDIVTGSGAPGSTYGKREAEITYRDIKVYLNGKKLNLVNVNGNKVEPFIMNGTTYLPLRVIGEALDLNIKWDSSTSTIHITDENNSNDSMTLEEAERIIMKLCAPLMAAASNTFGREPEDAKKVYPSMTKKYSTDGWTMYTFTHDGITFDIEYTDSADLTCIIYLDIHEQGLSSAEIAELTLALDTVFPMFSANEVYGSYWAPVTLSVGNRVETYRLFVSGYTEGALDKYADFSICYSD